MRSIYALGFFHYPTRGQVAALAAMCETTNVDLNAHMHVSINKAAVSTVATLSSLLLQGKHQLIVKL